MLGAVAGYVGEARVCPTDNYGAIAVLCCLSQLTDAPLDGVIADEFLFRVIGLGKQQRDRIKAYREHVANRPDWLEEWRIACVNADLKPGNLAFRANDDARLVFFDFGAARLVPMEQELAGRSIGCRCYHIRGAFVNRLCNSPGFPAW